VSTVSTLATLQQVQANLAALFPGTGVASTSSDSATVDAFQQILATLSSTATAGGVLGSGSGLSPTSANAPTPTPTPGVTGAQVVADAKQYLGIPYVLGGESSSGIDCSGLVQKTYRDLGISLPRTVHEQKLMGTAVPSLAQAQPGDLIVFKGGGHIAIYEGNGRVLHAPYPGRVVSDQKLWVGDSGIETIRRIVPDAGATGASGTSTTPASATPATSAAVQAAALATVQALIQADFGLISSSPSTSTPTSSSSAATQQALTQLQSLMSPGQS
jgi:cell wall-associated NlpC family hydrolase